ICLLLMLASQVLNVVGFSFTVTTPGRHGEMGFGIATLAVAACSLLCFLYVLIKTIGESSGVGIAEADGVFGTIGLGELMANPLLGIMAASEGGFGPSGLGFVLFVMPLLVTGWLTTSCWYLFCAGKTLRDPELSSQGFIMGITLPSTLAGCGLVLWLIF